MWRSDDKLMSWGTKTGGGHGRPGTTTHAGVQAGCGTGAHSRDMGGCCGTTPGDVAAL